MQAQVVWQGDSQFIGVNEQGAEVIMAGPGNTASVATVRPMEMLLMGVGGCAAYDVVHILKKSRQPISKCQVRVEAKRADAVPAVFTDIHLHFVLSGEALALNQEKVARAVDLSAEKYCSASIMMASAGVHVTHSFEVVE